MKSDIKVASSLRGQIIRVPAAVRVLGYPTTY